MDGNIRLSSWDSKRKMYALALQSRRLSRVRQAWSQELVTDGVVKCFAVGGCVALFRQGDEWSIYFGDHVYPLTSSRLSFGRKRYGVLEHLTISVDAGKEHSFWGVTPFYWVNKLDPTYDSFDEENENFVTHLLTLRSDRIASTPS